VSDRGEAPRKERDVPDERKHETERGPTPWERFVSLARKVTQTPKAEIEKREKEWREKRSQRRENDAS
jgi:hypothetical protein